MRLGGKNFGSKINNNRVGEKDYLIRKRPPRSKKTALWWRGGKKWWDHEKNRIS